MAPDTQFFCGRRVEGGPQLRANARRPDDVTKKKNPHIGSLFQDWLKAEGIQEEANNAAIKAIVSWQFEHAMKEGGS